MLVLNKAKKTCIEKERNPKTKDIELYTYYKIPIPIPIYSFTMKNCLQNTCTKTFILYHSLQSNYFY